MNLFEVMDDISFVMNEVIFFIVRVIFLVSIVLNSIGVNGNK